MSSEKAKKNMDANNSMESREKERDRRGRGARGSRFSEADGGNGNDGDNNSGRDRSRERRNCRVYISNIPYDFRWQDLKDLFRRIVGSVEYVELFHDESGKARGCGICEFKDPENVQKCLEKMNRYELNGRELVVKEDHGEQRDQYGRIVRDGPGGGSSGGGGAGGGGGGGGGHSNDRDRSFSRRDGGDQGSGRNNFNNQLSNNDYNSANYNFYGLSASFLENLGINGPLHNKVFVANLDYKVDGKKLKQVFKLAGKVQHVDLAVDKEGNSRGFAVVEYDHPVEAVQAISMLQNQMLYDRRMSVRLDRIPDKGESLKLPEGLGGVGIGLGFNGEPLKDVARNLPNNAGSNQIAANNQIGLNVASGSQQLGANISGLGAYGGNAPVPPVAVSSVPKQNSGQGLNLNNLNSSNLAAVVGALSNPLLSSSLGSLGLNLGNTGGNNLNDDSNNAPLSNNYNAPGNNYTSGFGNQQSGFNTGSGLNAGSGVGSGYNSYLTGGNQNSNNLVGSDCKSSNQLDLFGGGGGGNANTGGNLGGVGGNVGAGNAGNASVGRKSDTIVIKNLPLTCTWQTLRDKFRDVGEVKFAEIKGNEVGVVRFFKERDAELAIALMDGSRLEGRTIAVAYF